MFKKILIANRGEIACRIIRTAQKMGIKTVAVYSDADARSPHVEMADEAVHIGPSPAADSYLLAAKIIEACKTTGAEAVHPGYGFLSERMSFATELAANNITFIGPPPKAIAAMGDKIASKKLAKKAGVNIVPGHIGEIVDTDEAVKIAADIGYPVMMKASAGGGGKGMRLAFSEQDVRDGFEATKREGLASFGDDRVFIEKFIENPRHIEIQILGDKQGTILHLGERECSIQRRHQKVVEEAPSPFVDQKMREEMGAQAVALSRAVDYHSAGTVEFIVGSDKEFFFLEMNTRLQVEHPVTEYVTGIDLVEQMIRVAAGEKISMVQSDIKLTGWAIENRIYAENPYRNFLPSTGRLVKYAPPEATENIRIDDGVREGGEVSIFYDPMIAKLITYGKDRLAAIDLQIVALDQFEIDGPGHNIDFLSAIMQHPRFRKGEITTGFIAEEYPDGFSGAPMTLELKQELAVIVAIIADIDEQRAYQIDHQLGTPLAPPTNWVVSIGEQDFDARMSETGVILNDKKITTDIIYAPGEALVTAIVNGNKHNVQVKPTPNGYSLNCRGAQVMARVLPAHIARYTDHMLEKQPADLSNFLLCPMPGVVISLKVKAGDKVEQGQPLAIVEAMKMENILRAETNATVKAVPVQEGDNLAVDAVILEFE